MDTFCTPHIEYRPILERPSTKSLRNLGRTQYLLPNELPSVCIHILVCAVMVLFHTPSNAYPCLDTTTLVL